MYDKDENAKEIYGIEVHENVFNHLNVHSPDTSCKGFSNYDDDVFNSKETMGNSSSNLSHTKSPVLYNANHTKCHSTSRNRVKDQPKATKRKGLNFAHLNVRSMRKKMDDIKMLSNNEDVDIFTISESWLDPNVSDSEVNIPGYNLFRRDRKNVSHDYFKHDTGHGGTVCYVKDHINATYRNDLNDDDIEALWVELKPSHSKPILVCTFYRPPDVNVNYFKKFDQIVQSISFEDIVILGDFNLDCLIDRTSNKVDCFCVNNQLTQIISEPTRVTETSSTLIDLICVSKPEEVSSSEVVYSAISDHYLVKYCKKHSRGKNDPKTSSGRCYKKLDELAFTNDMANVNWNDVMVCNDTDNAWNMWKHKFLNICDKHAPVKIRKIKTYLPPWITPEYKELAHKRDYLKRKAQLSNHSQDWKSFKDVRNRVNLLNRTLKREYFHDVIKENVNNTRKLWKTLREHGGLGSKSSAPTGDSKKMLIM